MSAILAFTVAALTTLPTLPTMGAPREPAARARAQARVDDVYAAIDAATEDPDMRAWLRRRCATESWCNWYGQVTVHPRDASRGRARWQSAVDRGLLDPDGCAEHQLGDPAWWSTVGAFGTAAAYVVRHLGPCVGPRALVDPAMAARAAVAHAEVLCRRYEACSCWGWARWWAGPGRWSQRFPSDRIGALERQCGELGAWDRTQVWAATPDYVLRTTSRRAEQLVAAGIAVAAPWLQTRRVEQLALAAVVTMPWLPTRRSSTGDA